jgi:hypothetical protein
LGLFLKIYHLATLDESKKKDLEWNRRPLDLRLVVIDEEIVMQNGHFG